MGVLQALEAIKILSGGPVTTNAEDAGHQTPAATQPTLLIFSAYSTPQFRTVRLRGRRKDCAACSSTHTVTRESLTSGSLDYIAFCGVTNPVSILSDDERITPQYLAAYRQRTRNLDNRDHDPDLTILDVRDPTQFELCSLPHSINVPFSDLGAAIGGWSADNGLDARPAWLDSPRIACICKLGNDSQVAARMLKDAGLVRGEVVDVTGGFRAWRREIDAEWPDY